jgi:hypothetical protein
MSPSSGITSVPNRLAPQRFPAVTSSIPLLCGDPREGAGQLHSMTRRCDSRFSLHQSPTVTSSIPWLRGNLRLEGVGVTPSVIRSHNTVGLYRLWLTQWSGPFFVSVRVRLTELGLVSVAPGSVVESRQGTAVPDVDTKFRAADPARPRAGVRLARDLDERGRTGSDWATGSVVSCGHTARRAATSCSPEFRAADRLLRVRQSFAPRIPSVHERRSSRS